MSKNTLYVAVTNHGFGHAVRVATVINHLQEICPEISIIMTTTAPRWLLESYISGDFIHRPKAFDVGVIQADSLNMDLDLTLQRLEQIFADSESLIEEEARFIQENQVGLILADIPPLATKIAKKAGIPCWMISNFGWDLIYRAFGDKFTNIADQIAECFSQCDRLYRLPLHEPMSAFTNIIDVGLTGGKTRYDSEILRNHFKIHDDLDKTVLLTFGGLGLETIPYDNLQDFPDWQFITFDKFAPVLPNLINAVNQSDRGENYQFQGKYLRPVDFMPLCGQVVSKPGYSTFAEALRLDTPIISLQREGFAETPFLLEAIQDYSKHLIINNQDFFQGSWDFLHQPLKSPRTNIKLDKFGTEVIAQAIRDFFMN